MRDQAVSQLFGAAAARDAARARLLRAFLASGLLFMLGPGTLLGVMNLLQISGRESVALVSPAWIQAHGHAQVFGWIGSFMLGIGVYSVPSVSLRRRTLGVGWTVWTLWTAGVVGRWIGGVYGWHWRILLPASATCELAAFFLFLYIVSAHRSDGSSVTSASHSNAWIGVVMVGVAAWVVTLALNLITAVSLARHAADATIPHVFDQRMLALLTWGILAPFIWGFSARWMPVLLGLPPLRVPVLFAAVSANVVAILFTFVGHDGVATALMLSAAVLAVAGLRLFERPVAAAKTRGVHAQFPLFVRLAYVWLIVAAGLAVAAAHWDIAGGLWGASRHAFTVGFAASMVLAVGQRMLPGFAAHRALWSPRIMGFGLTALMVGCLLRVSMEVLAYEQYASWAWSILPASGVIELVALTSFAINLYCSLWV